MLNVKDYFGGFGNIFNHGFSLISTDFMKYEERKLAYSV